MLTNKQLKNNLMIVKPDDFIIEQYFYLGNCETILRNDKAILLTVYNFDNIVRVDNNKKGVNRYFKKENKSESIPDEALEYLYLDIFERGVKVEPLTTQDIYKYIKNKVPKDYIVKTKWNTTKEINEVQVYKNSIVESVIVEFTNERYVKLVHIRGTSVSYLRPNYGNSFTNTLIYNNIDTLLGFLFELVKEHK
ncbi:hypothetical protein [Staphylococcus phage vB_SsapH-Golestan101-M]|nr:hypothetical protein [Staphylococcus phage vB_SsapH-Golestan101-M]